MLIDIGKYRVCVSSNSLMTYVCTFFCVFSSVDALLDPSIKPVVPFWNYFILKFQFVLLYFYAGVKKMSPEWLSGYAMTHLSYHWVFTPFR